MTSLIAQGNIFNNHHQENFKSYLTIKLFGNQYIMKIFHRYFHSNNQIFEVIALTNSIAYETRSFNAALTRALQ